MDIISHLSPLSPGLIDELEAFMAPGGEACYATQTDTRRTGGHQLPESPPDSGSENPYSPSESHVPHTITVSQNVLTSDYMLVHDHLPTHEILQQNGNYIYEELKPDNMDHEVLRGNLNDVVVIPQDPSLMELGSVRHDLGLSDPYQNRFSQMRVEMSELDQGIINPQLVAIGHESLTPVYTNLQEPSNKKRKHSQDVNSQVKCEPAALSPEGASQHLLLRPAPPSVDGSEAGDESPLQCIRFAPFQHTPWHSLYDNNLKQLPTPVYIVGADKGFNYSQIDEAFVCQKKNHFQVTCQIQVQGDAHYVKTADGFKKINNFRLHFYGVKAEDPSQEVRVEQSQSDRTKKPFHPVPVDIRREGSKVTVCRLHFAETTNNNMRKKGRPNPDQRHFQLVVALRAHVQNGDYMIAAQASDRIIVRASNPGQFESDCSESWWQRGLSENSVHFNGKVGINTDRPDESCVINGNLKLMGHIVQPSDARAKHNILELDTAQQLRNVQNIRVVKFDYDPSFAQHSGLLGFDPTSSAPQSDTGVIAQEVRRVLPEAVKEAGDVTLPNGDTIPKFLVVNKDRIFMENLGAVKELCKVTGNLESRIDQLERINKKLCKISIQRRDSARSSISNDSRFSALSNTSKSYYSECNIDQIRDIARNIRRHECCHKLSHNSPKYTRKQCKNCHNNLKYGKYYNYNKTCVKYENKSDKSEDKATYPTYVDSNESSPIQKMPDESDSSMSKKKETCLWLRDEDDFVCGNTKLTLCCRRKDRFSGDETELISNKILQIIITILIFIMAVCLVVMSALYFREHQELLSMKDTRHDKFTTYPYYGKLNLNSVPAPTHRATPDSNQIPNTKTSQHTSSKKTAKEKASLKTTQEYMTTPLAEPVYTTTTAAPVKIIHPWNIEQSPHISEPERLEVKNSDQIVSLIGGCTFAINTDNNLDADCQSSCLDPPQTFENQEPIERTNSDKDINETFARPLEIDNHPIIPLMPEASNNTKNLKNENDSLVKQIHDESIAANFIDQSKSNGTEGASGRLKRGAFKRKVKRETNEALLDSASKEWSSADQDEDPGCYKINIGMWISSKVNMTLLDERICDTVIHNYSYKIPLTQCIQHKYVYFTFKTSLANKLRLCDVQCKFDSQGANCQTNRDNASPSRTEDTWTSKVTVDCNMDTVLKIRAGQRKDLCNLTEDHNIPFTEYNLHLIQSCHNQ